jgi:hypothetical protein
MVFLTCFVFDATYGCLHFVRKLRRARCKWPAETTSLFSGRLQLQEDVARDWINLELVARRTRSIGSLIYYPFVLIALLVVTSSTAFANYPPNLSSFIAVGASEEKSCRSREQLHVATLVRKKRYLRSAWSVTHRASEALSASAKERNRANTLKRAPANHCPSCISPCGTTRAIKPVVAREHFWAA